MTLPIVRPHHPNLADIDVYFDRALQSGKVTNNGEHVREFERKLTEYFGVPTICFNNATSALIAMLRAVDVQGMDVIVPSFTFVATPHSVVMAGGRPIFADIDEKTLCLDPVDVDQRITGRTTAILGVDPYGICWQPPKHWGDGNIDILIDSAPSFGSLIDGEKAATRGRAQVYSFHATKPFSTMEGGCLCSTDTALIDRAKAIRNFGISENGKVEYVGINGKMQEINAIIGLKQLETWSVRLIARTDSATGLRTALEDIKGLRVFDAPENHNPVWTYQPVFIQHNFGASRDAVVKKLHDRGIMVRTYYEPCHQMPAYMLNPNFPSGHVPLRVTEHVAAQVIALPVYDDMTDDEIKQIASAFKAIQRDAA